MSSSNSDIEEEVASENFMSMSPNSDVKEGKDTLAIQIQMLLTTNMNMTSPQIMTMTMTTTMVQFRHYTSLSTTKIPSLVQSAVKKILTQDAPSFCQTVDIHSALIASLNMWKPK